MFNGNATLLQYPKAFVFSADFTLQVGPCGASCESWGSNRCSRNVAKAIGKSGISWTKQKPCKSNANKKLWGQNQVVKINLHICSMDMYGFIPANILLKFMKAEGKCTWKMCSPLRLALLRSPLFTRNVLSPCAASLKRSRHPSGIWVYKELFSFKQSGRAKQDFW